MPHLRLGDGDDWGGSLTTKGGTFFLGGGRDRLTLGKYDSVSATFPFAELTVKLHQHRAAFGGGIGSPVFGVEVLRAGARQLEVLGSSRADRITANGCHVLVRGGPGADVLTRGQDVVSICDAVSSRLEGGVGDDGDRLRRRASAAAADRDRDARHRHVPGRGHARLRRDPS